MSEQSIRVDIQNIDQLMNYMAELVIARSQLVDRLKHNNEKTMNEDISQLTRITNDLQDIVMKIRMVSLSTITGKFPRFVRDYAKKEQKAVKFLLKGQETELDRTVIEQLFDPLKDLIQLSIDLLETPAERKRQEKTEEGYVVLNASNEGSHVRIEISNDGEPFSEEEMKENDTLSHVKENLKEFQGQVSFEKTATGTKFILQIPLTLAIIQALLVRLSKRIFAIPISSVETTFKLNEEDVQIVQTKEVIVVRGQIIPLLRLKKEYSLLSDIEDQNDKHVVVIKEGQKKVALITDELIGQEDIVIKTLGKLLKDIKEFVGGAILGDGEIALIIDTVFLTSKV